MLFRVGPQLSKKENPAEKRGEYLVRLTIILKYTGVYIIIEIWNNFLYFTPISNIWLANEHTSVLFLFGEEENTSADIKAQIEEEQNIHGDIIQINGFMEHYNNLTLKTLYTLKLFLQDGKHNIIY